MRKGYNYLYYGDGKGKTSLAIGQGIRAIDDDLTVIMIQFLDSDNKEYITLKKLEPDFRIFRFEKIRNYQDDIDEETKREIQNEVQAAFNFTKKILETGECDILILDGILDAVYYEFLDEESLCESIEKKASYTDLILTGKKVTRGVMECVDFVYKIYTEKQL